MANSHQLCSEVSCISLKAEALIFWCIKIVSCFNFFIQTQKSGHILLLSLIRGNKHQLTQKLTLLLLLSHHDIIPKSLFFKSSKWLVRLTDSMLPIAKTNTGVQSITLWKNPVSSSPTGTKNINAALLLFVSTILLSTLI